MARDPASGRQGPARQPGRVRRRGMRAAAGADAGAGAARRRQDGFRGAEGRRARHRAHPAGGVIRLSGERAERRVEHWRNIAIAACEQSGRNRIPAVAPILDLPQYLGIAARENGLRFICAPGAGGFLRDVATPDAPISLLVGPEGGFEESELLAAHAAGFHAIRLGPRVLRTETAGPGAVAAMMALWGDW